RAALRVAQETADRTRAESSSSISLGTLRAIAIDQLGGVGPMSAPPSQQPQLSQPQLTATLQSKSVPVPAAPRSRKLAMISGGALLAVALASAATLRLAGSDAERSKAAASSPVPNVSLDQLKPAVSAVPSV